MSSYVASSFSVASGDYIFSEQSLTSKLYVIRYRNGKYKYFTPLPKPGELLIKSYLASVFDAEKYLNCTVVTNFDKAYCFNFMLRVMFCA